MAENMDVFILCGGEGKRLKKVSGRIPKPMIRIGSRPFLDIMIGRLRRFGFKRFILGTGYQSHLVVEYYKKHKIPGVEVVFSVEKKPLGTGGAVKKAKALIRSRSFFVLNGDAFSKFDPRAFTKFHKKNKAQISILLQKVKDGRDYGSVITGERSEITCFKEKDSRMREGFINAGVYIFNKNIIPGMPRRAKFSLEYDFFPRMVGRGLYGYKRHGFFIDIGTPKRYSAAKKYFLSR